MSALLAEYELFDGGDIRAKKSEVLSVNANRDSTVPMLCYAVIPTVTPFKVSL